MNGKRVLVVDDSPTQSLRTKLTLETLGFSVMQADNGKTALEIALREDPDVIISDILMPEMDGFELCHIIRTDKQLQHIPVILQTASYRAKEDREFGLDIGADAFIPKGASGEEIVTLIDGIVAQRERMGDEAGPATIGSKPFDALHAQRMLFRLLEETANLEQANVAIRIERNRAQKYLDVASVMMIAFDAGGKISMINPRGCQILGVTSQEAIGADWLTTFIPQDRHDEIARIHKKILSKHNKKNEYVEYPVLTRDGQERLIAWHNTPLTDDDGKISGVLSSGEDITERRQAEEQIRYSEAELKKAQAYAHVGSWSWDIASRKMTWSDEMYRIFGIPKGSFDGSMEDLAGLQLAHPDDASKFAGMRVAVFENKKPISFEFRILLANGSIRYVWVETGELILDENGDPLALKGVLQDITERKIAEIKIKESEEKYRSLFENVPDGVYRITPDGIFQAANPGLVHMLGYRSEKELLRVNFSNLLYEPDEQAPFVTDLEKGVNVQNRELRLRHKKGAVLTVLDNAIPVRDDDGAILYYEGTLTDITKLKQAETELAELYRIERQRVERLYNLQKISGQLAGIHSQQGVMDLVAAEARILVDCPVCAILTVEEESGEISVATQSGSSMGFAGRLGETLDLPAFRRALPAKGPLFVKNIDRETPELHELNLPSNIKSILAYPISQEGQVTGYITLGNLTDQLPSEGEIAAMELLSERTAAALANARLFEEINSSLQRLASLRTIDQAITGSLDINFTLGVLLDQLINQLQVDAADILLLDPAVASFQYGAGRGFKVPVPPHSLIGVGNSFASRAVLERRTIQVADLAEKRSEFRKPTHFAADGFVSMVCTPLIAKGQVKGVLEVFQCNPSKPGPDWLSFLETLAGQAAIAIDNAELFTNLQRSNADLSMAYDATIQGWSDALDLRDKETEGHTQRVTEMTLKLGAEMGIDDREMVHIRRGALLHDIGKMGIPDSILLKPGPLTDEEWVIMRKHPEFAYDLISPIVYLRPALDIPFSHHEKWDGSGYPRGLKGDQIPLSARIFAIVDVWDALTSDRPYRRAWPHEKTLAHIQEQSGKHFDPRVVEAFMRMVADGDRK